MAKLLIKTQLGEVETFVLPSESSFELKIGRHEESNIFIENASVSRHHALIIREGNKYLLRDSRSTTGTTVNGNLVHQHQLNDGDEISFGPVAGVFFTDAGRGENQMHIRIENEQSECSGHLSLNNIIQGSKPKGVCYEKFYLLANGHRLLSVIRIKIILL